MGDALKRRIKQERFPSEITEAMLNLFVATDHLRSKVEAVTSAYGITQTQYNVLRILRGVHPDGHARCEIISRMIERAPDVTRLIDRLEAQGFVERDRSQEDRRLSIARITKQGLELLSRMDPDVDGISRDLGTRLNSRDCKELSRICERIYGDET